MDSTRLEMRCANKLHGLVTDPGVVEIKCDSRFCGADSSHVVLHRFNATTGELLNTERYQNPPTTKGVKR